MTQLPLARATLVPDDARLDFLPRHFGPRFMLRGEPAIYRWLNRLSADYQGGCWHYYDIPGGFYLAPAREESMRIIWGAEWLRLHHVCRRCGYCGHSLRPDHLGRRHLAAGAT
jgi:hypothetical protein